MEKLPTESPEEMKRLLSAPDVSAVRLSAAATLCQDNKAHGLLYADVQTLGATAFTLSDKGRVSMFIDAKKSFTAAAVGVLQSNETFKFTVEVGSVRETDMQIWTGEYLKIEKLPSIFNSRYGYIPQKIYIRECYIRLYTIITQLMLDGRMDYGVALFTGVPGIGKSMFLIYFIYRFLHDIRFDDKRFALEFRADGKYEYFAPNQTGLFVQTTQDAGTIRNNNILVLCDILQPQEPALRAKWTMIFSSPDPRRYKQMMKNPPNVEYTMNTWSQMELMFLDERVETWYDDFVVFGGVPRHVTPSNLLRVDPHHKLKDAMNEKGASIAQRFFESGDLGALDPDYLLIHINPPATVEGGFDYDGRKEYSFASDHIFKMLAMKYEATMLAGARRLFNVGGASNA